MAISHQYILLLGLPLELFFHVSSSEVSGYGSHYKGLLFKPQDKTKLFYFQYNFVIEINTPCYID